MFFLDKIEEAQKELNGAEVSKKGKLKSIPMYCVFLTEISIQIPIIAALLNLSVKTYHGVRNHLRLIDT